MKASKPIGLAISADKLTVGLESLFKRSSKMDQRGFSLVEVLVASGLLVIVGASMASLFQVSNQDSEQLRAVRVATTALGQIEAAMKNPMAWRQTVANNPSFACTTSSSGCNLPSGNDGYMDFVLYSVNPGDTVTYSASNPTTRYAARGGPCPAGVPNPDPRCPLKYVAKWKPLCQTYPCTNPTLEIKVSLVAEFGKKAPPLNVAKYEYASVRAVDDVSAQSACLVLNGTYNVATGICTPKNAGRSCAAIGKPAQIITAVDTNGNISCSPLYSGQCSSTTQVMNGINTSGIAQCAAKVRSPNCPVDCEGAWGSCSKICGGGTRTYSVTKPAQNGGAACTSPAPGATQSCNNQACPTDCSGYWSGCSASCGGGTRTYIVTTWPAGGGKSCPFKDGDSMSCNTQACAVPVNCDGYWSSCDPWSGTQVYTVTQAPSGGGSACPSPLSRTCRVDCVGEWSSCSADPTPYKTYSWTISPRNGGTTCPYSNGRTDTSACTPAAVPVNCAGSWSACSNGQKTYTWTQAPQNGGASCPFSNGQVDSTSCPQPTATCNDAYGNPVPDGTVNVHACSTDLYLGGELTDIGNSYRCRNGVWQMMGSWRGGCISDCFSTYCGKY